jgi:hypothetical protein
MNSTRSPSVLDHVVLYGSAVVMTAALTVTLLTWRNGVQGLIQSDRIVYVGPPTGLLAGALHAGWRAKATARTGVRGAARMLCAGLAALAATHAGIVVWYETVFAC